MDEYSHTEERNLFKYAPEQSIDYWLLLHNTHGLGFQKVKQLSRLCDGRLENLPDVSSTALKQLNFPEPSIASALKSNTAYIERVKSWRADSQLHRVLTFNHPDYPARLREISSPPLVLFCVGEHQILHLPQIAIVGARKQSPGGAKIGRTLSSELVQSGWVVTSGLAMGMDTEAHRGALDNSGKTIAVMATGADSVYPQRNRQLAQEIVASGGCLITEFALGSAPKKDHFPRRNRIISGLSNGVLVVEAAIKSGSLITARYAIEQNREVFAVPGSVYNLNSRGCHYLIKQGAKLVEQVSDINEEFLNLQQIVQLTETKSQKKSANYPWQPTDC
ncbi:DNA-processing protein DprA [Planctobacterium marinum]|uniref:DNA processing protein DprA n=1 Tax=Planctobacterium marinum TaxID=1631968 RepID=A0AA48I234_9ALTE|nr:DNA processing protein DprA [Planctobacterium marinum]